MRVERLDLFAYGHYRDVSLDLAAPERGLTVVYGPNEAGKSTARRAFIAALFGIPNNTPDDFVHDRRALRVGVGLTSEAKGRLDLVRQGSANPVDPAGAPISAEVLNGFLGGVGRELYLRLFSVGHDELRAGSEDLLDADGEIGRLVFAASLGAGSLTGVLRRLDDRADRLYKGRGRNQLVTVAIKAHRDKMDEARNKRVRARDWEAKRKAAAEAAEQVTAIRSRLIQARVSHSRLRRICSALPLVAQRADLARRAGTLEAQGPVASRDWAERAKAAQQRLDAARRDQQSALRRVAALDEQVRAVVVSERVMARAAVIDRLVQGVDRYEKDSKDLLERRGQLDAAVERLSLLLAQLGLRRDDDRVVDEIQLTNVEELAQRHAALQAEMKAASDELAKIKETARALRSRMEELPAPPDVAALIRAETLAVPMQARQEALAASLRELATLESDAHSRAGRLGLHGRSLAEIEAIPVPSGEDIHDEQARRQGLAASIGRLGEERHSLQDERAKLEALVAGIQSKPGIPDPDALAEARARRDAGWRIAREAIETGHLDVTAAAAWAAGADFAGAYEQAVASSDAAADDRFVFAADLTSLDRHRARLDELAAALGDLAARGEALQEQARAAETLWQQRWEAAGVDAGEPKAMIAWREQHQQLVGLIREISAKRASASSETEAVAVHEEALRSAVSAAGHVPDPGGLHHLVAQAGEIIDDARTKAQVRRDVEAELSRAVESLPAREAAVERQKAAMQDWGVAWAEALQALRLPPSTQPGAALAAVRAYRALPGARQEVEGFEKRISGIERDLRDFAGRVDTAAEGVTDRAAGDPLSVVAELKAMLAAAREATTRRETLNLSLEEASVVLRRSEDDLAQAAQEISRLRTEIGLAGDVEMGAVVDRSFEWAELVDRVSRIEADLVSDGSGRSLREILDEVAEAGTDGDELAAATAHAAEEIERLEADLERANVVFGQRTTELEAVSEESTAADLEQEAQQELASAVGYAADYVRTAVSAKLLRRVMAEYGERHKAPMLARAGDVYSKLTVGAFAELVPDIFGASQKLLAKRRNGDLLTTAKLSDGARDQLYLALRVAGIEYQLERLDEPVPVVFDDVLVNFDDERSEAALGVLASLGEMTQVLLFTHHESLVASAVSSLGPDRVGVVRLEARDHDLPVVSGSAAAGPG
jgi:uncharacterized protein YhaN